MRSLSIGLLNLNQAALTLDVIRAVATLGSLGWRTQLLILDQASAADDRVLLQSGLEKWGASFEDMVFTQATENLGAAAGRNHLIDASDGDRILILDNDLELETRFEWLDALWTDLDADPRAGIVGPLLVFARHPRIVQAAGIGLTRLGRVAYLHRGDVVDDVPQTLRHVTASPAACWLLDREVQKKVGPLPEVYYPMHYWDVDYCLQMRAAGYKVLCDQRHSVRHIANVTTRAVGDRDYARLAVRHGMIFRDRWHHVLDAVASVEDSEIYWGPIPRV